MSSVTVGEVISALAEFSSRTRLYELAFKNPRNGAGLLVEAFAADEQLLGIGGVEVVALSTRAKIEHASLLGQEACLRISCSRRVPQVLLSQSNNMLTSQSIRDVHSAHAVKRANDSLYFLIDHAGIPRLYRELKKTRLKWVSLFEGTTQANALSVAPLLICVGTASEAVRDGWLCIVLWRYGPDFSLRPEWAPRLDLIRDGKLDLTRVVARLSNPLADEEPHETDHEKAAPLRFDEWVKP